MVGFVAVKIRVTLKRCTWWAVKMRVTLKRCRWWIRTFWLHVKLFWQHHQCNYPLRLAFLCLMRKTKAMQERELYLIWLHVLAAWFLAFPLIGSSFSWISCTLLICKVECTWGPNWNDFCDILLLCIGWHLAHVFLDKDPIFRWCHYSEVHRGAMDRGLAHLTACFTCNLGIGPLMSLAVLARLQCMSWS